MALLRSRARRGRWFLAAGLAFLAARPAAAQTVRASASEVQAVFLFNFAQFVDWPVEAFPDPQSPLVIGILGQDPFGTFLDRTVQGETVRGRPFKVSRYRRVEEVKDCHILFISRSETKRLDPILAALKDRPILTVSNGDDFARPGGIIRFLLNQSKIRLSIDLEAAQAARLTFSSKLLRSAEIVAPSSR
ncbi:MAG: YfiR family protein [Gemmatimonadales bacterium]